MPQDVATLLAWSRVVIAICAVCVTLFPLLYAFSPWYKSKLGVAVMLQSVAVALAIDYSAARRVLWPDADLATSLIVFMVLMGAISITQLFLVVVLIYYNFLSPNREDKNVEPRGIGH